MHIRVSVHLLSVLLAQAVCVLSDDDEYGQKDKGIALPVFSDNDNIRYTVYENLWLSQVDAADVCRRQHTGGRLVTILDEETQWKLDRALNSSSSVGNWYWIGARLRWLNRWTWLDNTPYYEHEGVTWLQFPNEFMRKRGYASIKRISNNNNCQITVQSVDDQPQKGSRALCKSHDYFDEPAKRWHEGRQVCRRISNKADLAVLSDIKSTPFVVRNNTMYFIGLTNVRLIWDLRDRDVEATYTNWNDLAPRDNGNNSCVYASRTYNWKWQTKKCDERTGIHFICEHANPKNASITSSTKTTTSATTPTSQTVRETSASLIETEQATLHARSADKPHQSGELMWILLGGLVLLILAAVVVIVGVIFYFKRKSSESASHHRQQPQSYTNLQMQNAYDEYQPQYAAVHQPNVPDVCFGMTAGNRPDESAQYAEVGGPTIATDDGTQYANLPAGLPQTQAKKKKKKQPASAPTIHLSAATPASEAVCNAGGAVYASIVPTAGSQHTDRAEDNEYEMPTKTVVYASFDSC